VTTIEGEKSLEQFFGLLSERRNSSAAEICNLMNVENYNRIYDIDASTKGGRPKGRVTEGAL